MKIELRNLETSFPTEGELVEYQAEIWIDGTLAFEASSDGDFGQDVFVQVGPITKQEVDQWIGENRPAESIHGKIYPADLGSEFAPKPQGGDRRSRRVEQRGADILAVWEERKDISLEELRQALIGVGLHVSVAGLHRFFVRRGMTRKKRLATPSSRTAPTS
jgi:hypothetical protein